ncbi:LWR-salt protein [Halobellus rufus]|uniref:LWR-salt protein n=1 Tax=Halobellus rufus TaxID=1448860 RepID=UPI00067866AA|nr:LWR-salt protein [Halobellus rufus]
MDAAYVFRVTVRFGPAPGVTVSPETVETVVEVAADPPGEGEWLFFRDALWRGNVADERHARELAESWLSVPVDDVQFSELRLDPAYREALAEAIESTPAAFDGDDPRDVLHRHLGSSIRVVEE